MHISGYPDRVGPGNRCNTLQPSFAKGGMTCGRPKGHSGSHMAQIADNTLCMIWDDSIAWIEGKWYTNLREEVVTYTDKWTAV